jgi:hypothetical protein
VPMQNISRFAEIFPEETYTSTSAIQQLPTSFHLLPVCNATFCSASGDFINDDGELIDVTDAQNVYHLEYLQDLASPDVVSITFSMSANATKYTNSQVNYNDILSTVEIYNAKALGLDSPTSYTTEVTFYDGSSAKLNAAVYDEVTDRLMLPHYYPVNLPELERITFTKK